MTSLHMSFVVLSLSLLLAKCLAMSKTHHNTQFHSIRVVDNSTNRGVPLVTLRTTNDVIYITDSGGYVAFDEAYLMNQQVWFFVDSPGYQHDDVWGMRGKTITTTRGGSTILYIKRINTAVRLYRNTGAGIYRDMVSLGLPAPIKDPLINSGVMGLDSTISALYNNKIYWFWGDTNRASFPLGNFHVTAATSEFVQNGGLDVEVGINYDYFKDGKGFVKSVAMLEPKNVPTWIHSVTVIDKDMLAWFIKPKSEHSTKDVTGVVKWNNDKNEFEHVATLDESTCNVAPKGAHTRIIRQNDGIYAYFAEPYPNVRVKLVDPSSFYDFKNYEAYTCLVTGTNIKEEKFDRDQNGKIVYGWKKNTSPVEVSDFVRFVFSFKITYEEATYLRLKEWNTDRYIMAHRGSFSWNPHRKKYILILVETFGNPGMLGEIWFTESDLPEGPYLYAQRIATHDRVNLYNPVHHPFLDKHDGRIVYFEGTYTNTFDSGPRVPYYNYNQLMYRLDLNNITIPRAVYFDGKAFGFEYHESSELMWYAYGKKIRDVAEVPVFFNGQELTLAGDSEPIFYACNKLIKNTIAIKIRSGQYEVGSENEHDYIVFNKK